MFQPLKKLDWRAVYGPVVVLDVFELFWTMSSDFTLVDGFAA